MLGLSGLAPESIDPDDADRRVADITANKRLVLSNGASIAFDPARDIDFNFEEPAPVHPNTIRFVAFDRDGRELLRQTWYSLGGGFIRREGEAASSAATEAQIPFDYADAAELIALGDRSGLTIAEMVRANEAVFAGDAAINAGLDRLVAVMFDCIERGMRNDGELPGGLKVKRRARGVACPPAGSGNAQRPQFDSGHGLCEPVCHRRQRGERLGRPRGDGADQRGRRRDPRRAALLFRALPGCLSGRHEDFSPDRRGVGGLCKRNASISGAEVGCQGEVGVACAMAAAGLAAALGGSNRQIENAAEIGMEHHLGMTCDPIGGLVQIPCIERNAFGAIKAINAASLALSGDGSHHVTLDQVIRTMRDTGADMQAKYKETSRGGLAVNVPDC